jgi:hypothetical protein
MRNAKGDSEKEKGLENDKERDRNSLRVCIKEKRKKLEVLIRVYKQIEKDTARKKTIGK